MQRVAHLERHLPKTGHQTLQCFSSQLSSAFAVGIFIIRTRWESLRNHTGRAWFAGLRNRHLSLRTSLGQYISLAELALSRVSGELTHLRSKTLLKQPPLTNHTFSVCLGFEAIGLICARRAASVRFAALRSPPQNAAHLGSRCGAIFPLSIMYAERLGDTTGTGSGLSANSPYPQGFPVPHLFFSPSQLPTPLIEPTPRPPPPLEILEARFRVGKPAPLTAAFPLPFSRLFPCGGRGKTG